MDEGGARRVSEPTFFYMPHCEEVLYDALLRANWGDGDGAAATTADGGDCFTAVDCATNGIANGFGAEGDGGGGGSGGLSSIVILGNSFQEYLHRCGVWGRAK